MTRHPQVGCGLYLDPETREQVRLIPRVRRCWCGRSIPPDSISYDGVHCTEHDDPPEVEAAMRRHPAGKALPQTADIRDYLCQKGEL